MSARATFSGKASQIAIALAPHAGHADWLKPAPLVESRSGRQRRIIKHGPLLLSLEKLAANLSFTKPKMDAALKLVHVKACEIWPEPPPQGSHEEEPDTARHVPPCLTSAHEEQGCELVAGHTRQRPLEVDGPQGGLRH